MGRDLVAERIRHAQGKGPKPEAEPANPATLGLMNTFRSGGSGAPGG